MREFYFADINKQFAYRGIVPHNDTNWPPYDYFRYLHALNHAKLFNEILTIKYQFTFPEKLVNQFILNEVDKMLAEQLKKSHPKPEIHSLLTNETLTKKEQEKLLKGLVLNAYDIMWLNKEAQELGYLLDIYHEEKLPEKFISMKKPMCFCQKEDQSIETIGDTIMTEGEMRALLEQRNVVQVRIYHKGSVFHCFYFTYRGLLGQEGGLFGPQPHYHYISDKYNLTKKEIVEKVKKCKMPSSKVHIIIDK